VPDPVLPEAVNGTTTLPWDLTTLNTSSFIFGNLIPVTLGNIFSGAVLVGAVYWYLYVKSDDKNYENVKRLKEASYRYSLFIIKTVKAIVIGIKNMVIKKLKG